MKVLFVVENLASKCGANVNIILNLARQLKVNNSLSILAKENNTKTIDLNKTIIFEKCNSFWCNESEYLAEFQKEHKWSNQHILKKILLMLIHPKVPIYMLDTKYFDSWFTRCKYIKEIEKICSMETFDIVVAVCAPYYLGRALVDSNIDCKKIIFQLDPYSYNHTMPSLFIKKRRKIEERSLNKVDKILAVSFVYDDILKNKIFENMDKISSFMLPGIIVDEADNCLNELEARKNSNVNFVFVGQFYDEIRNPKFLLELFCYLPDNYIFHIFGGGTEKLIQEYKSKLGNRLICHGWVSSEEAKKQMYNADILININNTIQNQMSSKLFEYIGTGRPILNICKKVDCSSLKYSKKYSLCLDVIESASVEQQIIDAVIDFVNSSIGKIVSKESILTEFNECTDLYVAGLIEQAMKEIKVS